MAEVANQDAGSRDRIIKHMNKDHQDSLTRYLEFFCRMPSSTARTARLEDVTLEYMILKSTAGRHIVYFEPPLRVWKEVRERVVKMDQDALAGLGRSSIVIKEYDPPKGFQLVVFVAAAMTFMAFCRRRNFLPGSWLYDTLLHNSTTFAEWMRKIQPLLFPFMITLHSSEAIWMDMFRLQKHGVLRFSPLWFLWISSNWIEGYGAILRFDNLVRREQAAKDNVKH